MRPLVSKTPTKKSFFSLMKGDIAQRSIRSSMSRIVDARLPRMISRVTGSTRRASGLPGISATAALQKNIAGVVHAGPESWSHQRRRVFLGDDGRALEAHSRRQGPARVGGRGDEACAPEVDLTPIGHGVGRPRGRGGGRLAAGQGPDGGDAEIDELDGRTGQIIRVEPPVRGVE